MKVGMPPEILWMVEMHKDKQLTYTPDNTMESPSATLPESVAEVREIVASGKIIRWKSTDEILDFYNRAIALIVKHLGETFSDQIVRDTVTNLNDLVPRLSEYAKLVRQQYEIHIEKIYLRINSQNNFDTVTTLPGAILGDYDKVRHLYELDECLYSEDLDYHCEMHYLNSDLDVVYDRLEWDGFHVYLGFGDEKLPKDIPQIVAAR